MAFIVVVSLTDNNKYPTGIGNKLLFDIEFLTVVLFYSTDVAGIGHRSSLHVSSRCLPAAFVVTGEDKRSHDLYSDNLRTCTISAYNNGGQEQLLLQWIVGNDNERTGKPFHCHPVVTAAVHSRRSS